ncbi:MAG: 2-oxoacid:acceptor oxidoreductase family protein [bacterium]
MPGRPKYPGIRVTTNGNQLVAYHTEARLCDAGIFYPITPSTEMGENYQLSYAEGKLNVFGQSHLAIETEGEHAAQGGAIAFSVTGKRVVNFTSGQGIVYGVEQYYHAPGKLSCMVLEVAARALTKHALNVHCGHDDIYGCLDTGWIMLFAMDSQQAADQALILRRVCEESLTPGINIQDGFLTSHLERTFFKHEAGLIREFLGAPEDIVPCPTEAQRTLFGPTRPRVPAGIDLKHPTLLGPVQNQEHYMQGVVARRNEFTEPILGFLEQSFKDFGELTGRHYGFVSEYKTEDAETVYVSLGSSYENIMAAVDHLRDTRDAKVGCIHINVIRPFPEAAVVAALKGKKNVIILERTDEAMAPDNPLARDIRTALTKAINNHHHGFHEHGIPPIGEDEMPRLFAGVYGLGSRDFRPEGIIGAWEFVTGAISRTDGHRADEGESFMVLGIDHPYEVKSAERPSLLPHGAIAVRFHSIGGWGMITTGKNLGEIIGEFGDYVAKRENSYDEFGRLNELIHVSANPKYGSEKKGAPTEYFMVTAPERIRPNCDLRHVTVVLCCDPKAFTHCDPLEGMVAGGAFIWESDEPAERAWERVPMWARKEILEKKIKVYVLPGFAIARRASNRAELQLRMQGNAFLGAFFRVSPFLEDFKITQEHFGEVVRAQYVKKFSRFGESVIESNMKVMTEAFETVKEITYGKLDDLDRSSMRGPSIKPMFHDGCNIIGEIPKPPPQKERAPLFQLKTFDNEFRANLGYHQPATALSAVGIMAAATGATASKYVARRETPLWIAENCTQCMDCISACPDTALPNTAQDLATILSTAFKNYVSDPEQRQLLLNQVPQLDTALRAKMKAITEDKSKDTVHPLFYDLVSEEIGLLNHGVTAQAKAEALAILHQVPVAFQKVNAIFSQLEKKTPGGGGVFQIFVSDLCKGCGECVTECGDHEALKMVQETEEVNAEHTTGTDFMRLLPDTNQKYLGLYDDEHPEDSRAAALKNHLMVIRNYEALVSGDGACAGCGEKSVLRAIATLTEAYMRPMYHRKAERLRSKADQLDATGPAKLTALQEANPAEYQGLKNAIAHLLMGIGGENDADSVIRMKEYEDVHGVITAQQLIESLTTVMRTDAFNHRDLQSLDGRLPNGMSVMAMGAHTGCNTVYGSTPPNNPHPYPWMNSLFQDGATITWMFGESFIVDHARRSVIPERVANALLARESGFITKGELWDLTHFTDILMTEQEIRELPKAWCVGGDGGMGDIGFQNVSKVVLQNRPNVKLVMLDTQVYSNTGGQNSDSSVMMGGYDMNQIGAATQGKMVEKKGVAESFLAGHGSAFVAQVSMANSAKFFKAILDGLEYRGTAFFQCFTTCQPEHGVADDVSTIQAQRIRDARGMAEFVFNPALGETYAEALDVKGNPMSHLDWWENKFPGQQGGKYRYTTAHWAATENRFRRHLKKISPDDAASLIHLEDMLIRITQHDVVERRFIDPTHRAFVPDFGVYIVAEDADRKINYFSLSRQLVLFCVERRKAWRLLQSKAGIRNVDYEAQKALLADLAAGKMTQDEFFANAHDLYAAKLTELGGTGHKPGAPAAPKPDAAAAQKVVAAAPAE